jgi:hypothetical protein
MKRRIKAMLYQVKIGFLYVQKPIGILITLVVITLLTLGAITKYGNSYEAGIEYTQKYTVEKQEAVK